MRTALATMTIMQLTGCAGRPIVDMKGVDPMQYQRDLEECENYASQVNVAGQTATGAVAGTVVGAVVSAVIGNRDAAERSAGAGAVIGGAKSTGRGGAREKHRVVHSCSRHRGYVVLN